MAPRSKKSGAKRKAAMRKKPMVKLIKKVLTSQLEKKMVSTALGRSFPNLRFTSNSGCVANTSLLLPPVTPSGTAWEWAGLSGAASFNPNSRVGYEITPTSLTGKYTISLDMIRESSDEIAVRVLILSSKSVKSYTNRNTTAWGPGAVTGQYGFDGFQDLDKLLKVENSAAFASSGIFSPQPQINWTAQPLYYKAKINHDAYTVHHDNSFTLSKSQGTNADYPRIDENGFLIDSEGNFIDENGDLTEIGVTGVPGVGTFNAPNLNYKRSATFRVPLPKTLKYSKLTDIYPENAAPFMVVCYTRFGYRNDDWIPLAEKVQPLSVDVMSEMRFTDA